MQGSEAEGFAFERLDVYQRAIAFLVVAARIISELPGGNASLTDQLRRAALSVPVNLAEGVERSSCRGSAWPLRNRSWLSDGMCRDSRCLQGSAAGEPGPPGTRPVASASRRQDAEQAVLLNSAIVHVHDYVTITSTVTDKMGSAPD